MIHFDPAQVAMGAAILGKLFITAADTMPPPPEDCGFWCRWFFDFVQRLSSNSAKVGGTR